MRRLLMAARLAPGRCRAGEALGAAGDGGGSGCSGWSEATFMEGLSGKMV